MSFIVDFLQTRTNINELTVHYISMGNLIWTLGVTFVLSAPILGGIPMVAIVGMVIMCLGWVLMALHR